MMRDSKVVGMVLPQRVMLSRAGWKDGGVEGVSICRWLVWKNGESWRLSRQTPRREGDAPDPA